MLFEVFRLDPVCKVNTELIHCLPPVSRSADPFFRNVDHGQIQHFKQRVIRWENGFGFCYFPELTIEILDGIRRIDHRADLRRVLEVSGKLGPVVLPGTSQPSPCVLLRSVMFLLRLSYNKVLCFKRF